MILKRGQRSPGIYFVLRGTIEVFYPPENNLLFDSVEPDEYFGDFSLLFKKSPFDYICTSNAFCLFIDKDDLLDIIGEKSDDFIKSFGMAEDRYLEFRKFKKQLSTNKKAAGKVAKVVGDAANEMVPSQQSGAQKLNSSLYLDEEVPSESLHMPSVKKTEQMSRPANKISIGIVEPEPEHQIRPWLSREVSDQYILKSESKEAKNRSGYAQIVDVEKDFLLFSDKKVRPSNDLLFTEPVDELGKPQTLQVPRKLELKSPSSFDLSLRGSSGKAEMAQSGAEFNEEELLEDDTREEAGNNSFDQIQALDDLFNGDFDYEKLRHLKLELDEEMDESIEMEDPIASMEYTDLDPSPDTALRMVEVVSMVTTGEVRPREEEV